MIIHATTPTPSVKATLTVTPPSSISYGTILPAPLGYGALMVVQSRVVNGHPVTIFDTPQVVQLTYPGNLAFKGTVMNNYPVNRTDFRLVRGVTNEVLFLVRDIDRKPVSLSIEDTLTIHIVDSLADRLLMSRALTRVDVAKGLYQFATLPSEMDTWPTGPVRWSVACTRGLAGTVMLWTDQNYSPYSTLIVTETPIPGPAPGVTIAWTDLILLDSWYYSSSLAGAAQDGYINGMHTFVCNLLDFTGTIKIDASLIAQPDPSGGSADWFTTVTQDYTGFSGNAILDVSGNYVWLRLVVKPMLGSLTQAQYKV